MFSIVRNTEFYFIYSHRTGYYGAPFVASKCLELRKFFANTEYFYRERVSA